MKKYDSILKRVEEFEYKMGVTYAKVDGKLFKGLSIFNLLAVIYLVGVNALATVAFLFTKANSAKGITVVSNQQLIFILLFTLMEIVSVVFLFKKLKITGAVLGIIPIPYLTYIFIRLCEGYESGFFGVNIVFYYRHLPSLAIITLCCVIMFIIALRQRIITKRTYNRIFTNIYTNYSNEKKKDGLEVSDDEWEEFITNYDPRQFNQ